MQYAFKIHRCEVSEYPGIFCDLLQTLTITRLRNWPRMESEVSTPYS